jgi:two-component system chemotaxis sensor kinase CheA
MDIVKTTIESFGGTLRINTQLGRGTRTTLVLPRTVAIMNVLLVKLDPQVFAVPIGKLIRTVELRKDDFQLSARGRMVLFEGEPIPVYSLRKLLHLGGGMNDRPIFPALVVEHGKRRFALLVDDFLGQEEAFIRPLGRPLSRIEGLAGVMTRGDGKPVFVLDVGNLT